MDLRLVMNRKSFKSGHRWNFDAMRNRIWCAFYLSLSLVITPVYAEEFLRLATTTSTENSGLLARLNPEFEKVTGIKIHVIAVGTGKALRLAEDGDVDMVLVHAPDAEQDFVDAGYGVERRPVMHNDFILLGPVTDPARVANSGSITEAMSRIAKIQALFVSRGDDSGTHKKEKLIWTLAGIQPGGQWYISVGQGMGQVLQLAYEMQAYTLSDRGTYLAYQGKTDLKIVFENGDILLNPYHIILVNPERHPHTKIESARQYSDFISGEQGQAVIRNFKVNGKTLFYPDVIK
jgi:tungstate transport system substrate-binding protein